jgi:hypothetical protein
LIYKSHLLISWLRNNWEHFGSFERILNRLLELYILGNRYLRNFRDGL